MATLQTPAQVAHSATTAARLPSGGVMLIGVFGPQSAPRALLRLPNGRTETVKVGDRVGSHQVVAIDTARIALARNGRGTWLTVAGTD